ncbi:MAG: hypothetical protein HC893_06100 [Chloroflexaceae bacterium]|nr:hypothetical protein [Chloroflexaceae bacterium]
MLTSPSTIVAPQPVPRPALLDGVVLLAYVLITTLFTYPLSLNLSTYISTIDSQQFLWTVWWTHRAIEQGATPYFTPYLYYPEGLDLYYHTMNIWYGWVAYPLAKLFGLVVAYNLVALLVFVVACYVTYWLAYDITRSRIAGFAAGLLFGFAPTQVFHFSIGQENLHSVLWMPLYVLAVRHWLAPGGRLRWLLTAAIALILTSYADWLHATALLLFSGVLALWVLVAERQQWQATLGRVAWRSAALGGLYTLGIGAVVAQMVAQWFTADTPYMLRPFWDTIYHSADVFGFFVPNPYHPFWGAWAQQQIDNLTIPGILNTTVVLPYMSLALAIVAAVVYGKAARFWLVCAILFAILALGPQLRIAGNLTSIWLPYNLLYDYSILRISRAPGRLVIMTLLALAVLAAIGIQAVLVRLAQHPRARLAYNGAAVLLVALVILNCYHFAARSGPCQRCPPSL